MARNGKIARLPRLLREELNRRLQNGTPGRSLVAWLNERAEVREVMAQHFGGQPVNEQNLTEWKQGGYLEWEAKQDFTERVRDVAGEAADLVEAGGPIADHAARMLAARYLLTLSEWDGDPDHPAIAKLRALSAISRELIALRRGDHSADRLRMEQTRFDKEQKDMEEIDRVELRRLMGVEFEKIIQRPDIQTRLEKGSTNTAEHLNNIIRVVWGEAAAGGLTSEDSRKLTAANLAINGDGI